jgi:DNA-binding NarL/FixJ family response regulator
MNPPEPSAQEAPTRVLLADDHALFRHGLKAMLVSISEYEVVGEAATGEEAVEKAAKAQPEIVLMDIQMPQMNSIEATRRIVEANPRTRVVMLTMFGDNDSVFAAMRAGTRGATSWRALMKRRFWRSWGPWPEIAERLMSFFSTPKVAPPSEDFPELTSREVEVLDLIARGRSNTEIARQLYVSPKTVRNHISSIFTKLQVADRAQAIVRAREAGLGREGAS